MQEDRRHHGQNYIVTKTCERMQKFQANSELGQIQEELEEEYASETDDRKMR